MSVKTLSVIVGVVAALVVTGLARADAPLAGAHLFTVSHGQPFCASRAALEALLRAQIARAPLRAALPAGCGFVPDNAVVAVTEDLAPGGRYMHVVRAQASSAFGTIDGYTYSVGLYPYPVRHRDFDATYPFADY